MNHNNCNYLKEKLKEWNFELTSLQEQQFLSYYELLIKWNSVMNLTGITEFNEVMDKHFLDSISMCHVVHFDSESDYKIIDVGTGAGFPGIPLKIMFPKLKVTLLDSLLKRIKFLDEVTYELGLKDVELLHGRAEDLGREPLYREAYDIATSRAVANLASLSEICLPFVKEQGVFVSYKSEKSESELLSAQNAITLLSGKVKEQKSFSLPNTNLFRSLIVIEKTAVLSDKYPRKAGVPFKRPLS